MMEENQLVVFLKFTVQRWSFVFFCCEGFKILIHVTYCDVLIFCFGFVFLFFSPPIEINHCF